MQVYPLPATNHNMPNTRLEKFSVLIHAEPFYNVVVGILWLALVAKSTNSNFTGVDAFSEKSVGAINNNNNNNLCSFGLVAGSGFTNFNITLIKLLYRN